MGEVINQIDCFQKQSDITNGAVDNKESLDPKNEMYNEMVERLSLLESECEKYKTQVDDLKREIKTCRQKSASLESEVADLKRKENELNILLDEYKNKKPEESTDATDGKEEELKLLRASEESLKNEIIELKVLVKQHENKLKDLQQKEVKLADDLTSKTQSELQISRVMDEYEKFISSLVAENEKMKKERDETPHKCIFRILNSHSQMSTKNTSTANESSKDTKTMKIPLDMTLQRTVKQLQLKNKDTLH